MTSAIHKEAKEAHSSSSSCRHHNTSDGIVTGSLFSCKNAKLCGFSVKSLLGAQTGLARSSCSLRVLIAPDRKPKGKASDAQQGPAFPAQARSQ